MYKIIVYEILYKKVQQKNRIIQKKYFLKIEEIPNVKKEDLSQQVIDLTRQKYKDSKYLINFLKMGEEDWYMNSLNKKSYSTFFGK